MSWLSKLTDFFAPAAAAEGMDPLDSPVLGKDSPFNLVPRGDQSMSGSEFGQSIIGTTSGSTRDNLFYTQIAGGNVPSQVRNAKTISITEGGNLLQYSVSQDVLSVGNDTDYLRVSVSCTMGRKICDDNYAMMPTLKMARQIWQSADLKLSPHPMGASAQMMSTKVLVAHNQAIQEQIGSQAFTLISGHKKDIVFAKHLVGDNSHLGIYGWFYMNGKEIQQLNVTSHDRNYQDYSQSIRLISRHAFLNNEPADLRDILASNDYSYLISDEGPYIYDNIYK